jgi:excisionase family DNA binding protein
MGRDCLRWLASASQSEEECGMDKLLSLEEVAQKLGVSVWTVHRLARSGRLASVRLGRRRLVSPADVEALVVTLRRGTKEQSAHGLGGNGR